MVVLKLGTKVAGKTKQPLGITSIAKHKGILLNLKPNANDSQIPSSPTLTSSLNSRFVSSSLLEHETRISIVVSPT